MNAIPDELRLDKLPDLIPEATVAKLLDVTPERLRRWSYQGRGPATIRIAGHRLIRRTELLRWLAEREV